MDGALTYLLTHMKQKVGQSSWKSRIGLKVGYSYKMIKSRDKSVPKKQQSKWDSGKFWTKKLGTIPLKVGQLEINML